MSEQPYTIVRAHPTEVAVAAATGIAPAALTMAAPWFTGSAALFAAGATAAWGVLAGLAHTGRMSHHLEDTLPGGDLVRGYAQPMLTAATMSTIGVGVGAIGGPEGMDALLAGFVQPASVPGIVSLGWWAATGCMWHRIRRRIRPSRKPVELEAPAMQTAPQAPPLAHAIVTRWAETIAADDGPHPGCHLHLYAVDGDLWTGVIEAREGRTANVTEAAVSSAYRIPTSVVRIEPGDHSGQQQITVGISQQHEITGSGLDAMWARNAARTGGQMPGTHLEDVQGDGHGGQIARVVCDDDTDALPEPDRRKLAGALRTTTGLISFEPSRHNPRQGVIRLMKDNPLRRSISATPELLDVDEHGFFRVGTGINGRPMRVQLLDSKLGGRHLIVSGVTGSGKSGCVQLIALAVHLAGGQIIYGDPKGMSNPAIVPMAAHAGLGVEGAMHSLRVARAVMEYRKTIGTKNFNPKVMPHLVVILDEAPALLGTGKETAPEAGDHIATLSKEGRSLGVSVVLVTQLLQLDQIGGRSDIRDNMNGSGGCIMLRGDSSQVNLIDLPPGCKSLSPADIPASWGSDDEPLVYNGSPLAAPEQTYGLGFFLTPDAVPMMGRTLNLEDGAGMVRPELVRPLGELLPGGVDAVEAAAPEGPAAPAVAGTLGGFLPHPEPTAAEKYADMVAVALEGGLDEHGEPCFEFTPKVMRSLTGLSEKNVKDAIEELLTRGRLVKVGHGMYAVPDREADA